MFDFNAGFWYNGHCDTQKGFICKRDPGSTDPVTDTPTEEVGGYCPTGFYGVGNTLSYLFISLQAYGGPNMDL